MLQNSTVPDIQPTEQAAIDPDPVPLLIAQYAAAARRHDTLGPLLPSLLASAEPLRRLFRAIAEEYAKLLKGIYVADPNNSGFLERFLRAMR